MSTCMQGAEVTPISICATCSTPAPQMPVARCRSGPQPPQDESQEIGWFDWDAAIDLADPGLRGALVALRPRT